MKSLKQLQNPFLLEVLYFSQKMVLVHNFTVVSHRAVYCAAAG
jgi:hypothetical protein